VFEFEHGVSQTDFQRLKERPPAGCEAVQAATSGP